MLRPYHPHGMHLILKIIFNFYFILTWQQNFAKRRNTKTNNFTTFTQHFYQISRLHDEFRKHFNKLNNEINKNLKSTFRPEHIRTHVCFVAVDSHSLFRGLKQNWKILKIASKTNFFAQIWSKSRPIFFFPKIFFLPKSCNFCIRCAP